MRAELSLPWSDIVTTAAQAQFNLNGSAILDLGCGKGSSVLRLIEFAQISRYLGIERDSHDSREINHFNIHKCYFTLRQEGFLNGPDYDDASFNRIFEVRYGVDAEEFLASSEERFDLIVLSNLLHLSEVKPSWYS